MNILDKSYKSNIDELKNKVITGQTKSIGWRINQINKVSKLLDENKNEIIKTLPLYASEDLKKVNFFKSLFTSINYLIWGDV